MGGAEGLDCQTMVVRLQRLGVQLPGQEVPVTFIYFQQSDQPLSVRVRQLPGDANDIVLVDGEAQFAEPVGICEYNRLVEGESHSSGLPTRR